MLHYPPPIGRILRDARVLLLLLCLFGFVNPSEAGLKIYYLRHAEGGHNVVKEWKDVPKEQWPAYVGNANMFTPKGQTQVAAVPDKLGKYHFDFIAVSPIWRTRQTILPYLKATGAKGELWPELHEFVGGARVLATNLPPLASPVLGAGARVELPPEEAAFFTLRQDGQTNFKLPGKKGEEQEAAIQLITQRAVALLRQRFGGTDQSILLVGHGNSGIALLKMLLQDPLAHTPAMSNTGVWMVEEQPDGRFQLKMYNDAPCEKSVPMAAQRP